MGGCSVVALRHPCDACGMTERRAEVIIDGARVSVFEYGSADASPLVLLHGYPQSHLCYRRVIPQLARTYRVIAPDWMGWGESERSLSVAPRFEDEARRLALLIDALALREFSLFGHDYGGLLAMAYATTHPERVLRLALSNTRAHKTFAPAWYLLLGSVTCFGRVPVAHRLLEVFPAYAVHRWILRPHVELGAFDDREVEGYLGWMKTAEGARWFAHFYRHFAISPRSELADAVTRLRCPIALIWGERDRYFPISIAEDLLRLVPHAVLHRVPADHYVMEERPAEVLVAIEQWLGQR